MTTCRESGSRSRELVHMDDVFGGWSGLEEGMDLVASDVIAPLRLGQPGHYRPFGWEQMRARVRSRWWSPRATCS